MADFFMVLFGLAAGSFLNVVIHRLPRDQSVIHPASACPACSQAIRWQDNIPVLSYVLLGGRCRHCRARISARYAAVEILNAALWFFLWKHSGPGIEFAFSALLFSLLLAIVFTDFETGLIPDELSLGGLAAGLVFAALVPGHFAAADWKGALISSVTAALTGGGLLYLTGLVGQLLFRKESMGMGDMKLLAMLGAFLGMPGVFFVFLIAPILALPAALFGRLVRKEETLPFGPYLAIAGGFIFLWGSEMQIFFWG